MKKIWIGLCLFVAPQLAWAGTTVFNPFTGTLDYVSTATITIPAAPTANLGVANGNSNGFTSIVSSPTSVINFSSTTLTVSLRGGGTAYVAVNEDLSVSTVTATAGGVNSIGSGAGKYIATEGASPSGVSLKDVLWADSTNHTWMMNSNNSFNAQVLASSTTLTAGHCGMISSSYTLVDAGQACGIGDATPGGSLGEVQINNGSLGAFSFFSATANGVVISTAVTLGPTVIGPIDGFSLNKATMTIIGPVAGPSQYILNVSSSDSTQIFGVQNSGHINSKGGVPAVASCGTTPAMNPNSTDLAGAATWSGSAAACTVTFKNAYAAAPFCVVSVNGTTTSTMTVSASSIVGSFSGVTGSTLTYHCLGGRGE